MISRIKEIIASIGISDRAFAIQCGIGQATLSRQLAGAREVSLTTVSSILDTYENISAEWLMRGKGKMDLQLVQTNVDAQNMSTLIDTISILTDAVKDKDTKIKKLESELANLRKH